MKARQCSAIPDAATQSSVNAAAWRAGGLRERGLNPDLCGRLTKHPTGLCQIHRSDRDRANFNDVFGDKSGARPGVTLRRFRVEDYDKHPQWRNGAPVGIFWGRALVAVVDFDDLFDADGNRFYND